MFCFSLILGIIGFVAIGIIAYLGMKDRSVMILQVVFGLMLTIISFELFDAGMIAMELALLLVMGGLLLVYLPIYERSKDDDRK